MKKYIFFGRVLPERASVTIKPLPEFPLGSNEGKNIGKAIISIDNSIISVQMEIENYEASIYELRNEASFLSSHIIDSFGYLTGRGYLVEIFACVHEGTHFTFGVGIPLIEGSKRPLEFGKTLHIALNHHELLSAFQNLRQAILQPTDTAFFCYRSIEAIRPHFGEDKKKAWEKLNTALKIKKNYYDEIRNLALKPRHGKIVPISDEERKTCFRKAWEIIDRFLIYLDTDYKLPDNYSLLKK